MKVTVCTGWGSDVSLAQKQDHSVNYVLAKPTRLADIEEMLSLAFKGKN
jgi:hypothetical protein